MPALNAIDLHNLPPGWDPSSVFEMDLAFRCQCGSFPDSPCVTRADQEDLRCEVCRDGCTEVVLTCNGRTRRHSHVRAPAWASA